MRLRVAIGLLALLGTSSLHAADHAVVLMYHHISETTPTSTSVTPTVFRQHLAFLNAGGYTVLPLGKILETLARSASLPEKTVGITFDDAYQSVLDHAAPLLKQRDWPYTIFVNTKAIDGAYRNYLSWEALRKLVSDGAEIGNHSDSHGHLVRRAEGESAQQWRVRVEADIQRAQRQLQKHLGITPTLFAYPYGEYTSELQALVGALGYFGIAQQSGAIGHGFDILAVPRFPMATNYADMKRFSVSVNTRPLPVRNVIFEPRSPRAGQASQQHFDFDLLPGDYQKSSLACYSNDGVQLPLSSHEAAGVTHVTLRVPNWAAGRRKINCTAAALKEPGVFYWYSQLWLVKQANGSWYEE